MKNKRLWILVAGITLIGAAFLFLNFRLAGSSTQVTKMIATTGLGDNLPVSMQQKDKISVVLVGEGPLVRAMQQALTEKMEGAGLGDIEVAQGLEPMYGNPVLVVKVTEPGSIWTPFFALSKFSVHAGYASNGDYAFMTAVEETHTTIGKPDIATVYAELKGTDRSIGLISRPGYYQFLGDYLAADIVAALKSLYKV